MNVQTARRLAQATRFLGSFPAVRMTLARALKPVFRAYANHPGPITVPFLETHELIVDLDDYVGHLVFWWGFQKGDESALDAILRHVEDDSVVIDVGANIGTFTVPIASAMNRGTVVAIEPVPGTVARLRDNVALNGLGDRVIVLDVALTSASGSVEIFERVGEDAERITNRGMSALHEVGGGRTKAHRVRAETLDRVVEELGLTRVDVLKMDIEGAESDCLEGARETIRRFRPMIVAEVNPGALAVMGSGETEMLRQLDDLGYRTSRLPRPGDLMRRLLGRSSTAYNIICVPRARHG